MFLDLVIALIVLALILSFFRDMIIGIFVGTAKESLKAWQEIKEEWNKQRQ